MSKEEMTYYEKVFHVARLIPEGSVTNYGAIAHFLGTGLSARMVGYAMNKSHLAIPPVPAHRVVNRNGLLTGKHHFGDPGLMQELLENEGHEIKNDQVIGFKEFFWDPAQFIDPSKLPFDLL